MYAAPTCVRCTLHRAYLLCGSLLRAFWNKVNHWLHLQVWQPRPSAITTWLQQWTRPNSDSDLQVLLLFFSLQRRLWQTNPVSLRLTGSLPSSVHRSLPQWALHPSGPAQSWLQRSRNTYTYWLKGRTVHQNTYTGHGRRQDTGLFP